jgi:16S rRNA (cytidine1402-2'-O)-methyltransferase
MNTTFSQAIEYYNENRPKGEFVIVVEGYKESDEDAFWADMTEQEHVSFYINGGMAKMDAIKAAAKDRKIPKGELYKKLL